MKFDDLKIIKERLSKKEFGSYDPPKNYRATSVKAPKPSKCRTNSSCYDNERFFMSDYAVSK